MKIKDIMTPNPEIAQITDSLVDVANKMRSLNVGFMPVVEGSTLVGVITDRDITIRAVADNLMASETNIGDIMSTDIHVVSIDTDLQEAANVMEEFQIRRLPVIDENGSLVGICSLGDIAVRSGDLEQAGEALEEISEPSRPERAA